MRTNWGKDAGTDTEPFIQICSRTNPSSCCKFQTHQDGPDLDKGILNVYKSGDLKGCKNFNPVCGVGKVTVTSTGTDGWLGDFINIWQGDYITHCPMDGNWVDDYWSISPSCEARPTWGRKHLNFSYK